MADQPAELRTPEYQRQVRLRRHGDFERVMAEGYRITDGLLTLWVRSNGLRCTRLGLVVGRKHGHAVRRNRLKRVLRAAFRACWAELPRGLDIACAPRAGATLELLTCRQSLTKLTARAARHCAAAAPETAT
ncbi:MAG: ribonuclease P protein component [Planctomycetes bacterium]|nr:ribonuclease P protein component [Planctomycetota bacterium]